MKISYVGQWVNGGVFKYIKRTCLDKPKEQSQWSSRFLFTTRKTLLLVILPLYHMFGSWKIQKKIAKKNRRKEKLKKINKFKLINYLYMLCQNNFNRLFFFFPWLTKHEKITFFSIFFSFFLVLFKTKHIELSSIWDRNLPGLQNWEILDQQGWEYLMLMGHTE